jgi:hypothetical protein
MGAWTGDDNSIITSISWLEGADWWTTINLPDGGSNGTNVSIKREVRVKWWCGTTTKLSCT